MSRVVPSKMKAVLLTGHGGLDKLEYREDVPVPKPRGGEALIEIRACGINNTDIWVREGAYGTDDDPQATSSWRRNAPTLTFPRIQGADSAGYIVAVGEAVDTSWVGQRVLLDASIYNTSGDSLADIDYIGHGRDGGYAEYTAVPIGNVHKVQTDMSDAELGTFWCAYHTGEQMLDRARVGHGERVLITGASGGVGSALVQLCRVRGAIPYAVVGAGKEQAVAAIGAEATITRGTPHLKETVLEATGGKAIDVVADLVAGPMFGDLLNILRPEGRYTTAGAIAGPVVPIDLRTVYLKHLELHGSSQGSCGAFARIVQYIEAGTIRALLHATYPLSSIHQAQTDFISKQHIGKLAVIPDRFYS